MKNVDGIKNMNKMTTEFNRNECIDNIVKVLGYDELEELPYHGTINNFLENRIFSFSFRSETYFKF